MGIMQLKAFHTGREGEALPWLIVGQEAVRTKS